MINRKHISPWLSEIKPNKPLVSFIFVIAILISAILGFLSYRQITTLGEANHWVNHTYQVIQHIDRALDGINELQSQQNSAGDNQQSIVKLVKIKNDLKRNLDQAVDLTADYPEQNKRVIFFKDVVNQQLVLLEKNVDQHTANQPQLSKNKPMLNIDKSIINEVKSLGHEIDTVEFVLLKERNAVVIREVHITKLILMIGNILSLLFLMVAYVLTNLELLMRKRAEVHSDHIQKQLRSIIESVSDMIAAFDKDHRFIIFNKAYHREFKNLFGKSIVIGMSLEEVLRDVDETKQTLVDHWLQSLVNHETIKTIETFKIGEESNIYEFYSSLVQREDNKIIGWVQTIRDVTKHKREHIALKKSYEQLATGMKELQAKNSKISLLVEMSDVMLACNSQDELNHVMATYSQRMLDFAAGYLFIMHPSKNYLEVAHSWGSPHEQESTFMPDECWAIKLGRKHKASVKSKELTCRHINVATQENLSYLCIPLMAQNDIYGLLYLEINQDYVDPSSEDNQKVLINAFAELNALALANVRLRDNLRHQSMRDPLTGLYNRRYLEDFLLKQVSQAERSGNSFAILMLDLDHFKKINDTYGHDAGDAALKELAKIMQSEIRSGDIAARYGGEEFIIMLYNTDLEFAIARAESIRAAIAMAHIKYGAQQVSAITISIGIAQYPRDGSKIAELIEAADKALYQAKKSGRNQIILSSGSAASCVVKDE